MFENTCKHKHDRNKKWLYIFTIMSPHNFMIYVQKNLQTQIQVNLLMDFLFNPIGFKPILHICNLSTLADVRLNFTNSETARLRSALDSYTFCIS